MQVENKQKKKQEISVEDLRWNLGLTLEQSDEKCRNCKYSLELYEEDAKRATKVMRCERCGMLHFYKKDIVGKWRLFRATKSELLRDDMSADLVNSASFLGLDNNWFLATSALQLQEVAVTLVANRKKIMLDKANVERILNKRIQNELSFNDRYEAFIKQVKDSFKIEMPILASHLRRMRVKVLHEGYNPQPEETKSIVDFTIGLLRRMESI